MKVTTHHFGIFGLYMGEKERVFEVDDGTTAADLLDRLGEECGARLPRSVWDADDRRFHRSIKLALVGGSMLSPEDKLLDGAGVLVIFPMAGG